MWPTGYWDCAQLSGFRCSVQKTNTFKKLLKLFPSCFVFFFFSLFHNSIGSGCWMQRKPTPRSIGSTRWQDYRCGVTRYFCLPLLVLEQKHGLPAFNHLLSRKCETKVRIHAASSMLTRSMDARTINCISTVLMRKHDADQSFPADTALIQPFLFWTQTSPTILGPNHLIFGHWQRWWGGKKL